MICFVNGTEVCFAEPEYTFEFDITCLLARMCQCSDNNEIARYIFDLGPYLYPFSIEFSILVGELTYLQD